ncbi:MAG: methyltransferase [Mariprofundus sp.]
MASFIHVASSSQDRKWTVMHSVSTFTPMSAVQLLYQAALATSPGKTAILNAQADPLLSQLAARKESLDLTQYFKPEHDALTSMGFTVSPEFSKLSTDYDLILLLPSKNKQQTHAWMAEAMRRLQKNGKIMMACANRHGAKSHETALKALAGNISSASKSKCRIFSACRNNHFDNELAEQWIQDAKPRRIETHGLISQPGPFSWDRADTGSSLLLEQLPALPGTGLDLCCGYGLLSEWILKHSPNVQLLHLIEADHIALECARANTQHWQTRVQLHWADAVSDPLPQNLDWIVCNPPFHSGQNRDIELGQAIVQRACQSLKKGGSLYLVANRKLPYEHLLQAGLQNCQTLIEKNGFKVFRGTGSRRHHE